MTSAPPLPETCGVAFKEWAGVCDAIADGEQSILLRKGGIAEGPRGFAPEHEVFWLYPTRVHQAEQGLRRLPSPPTPASPADVVELGVLVRVAEVRFVDRLETLHALADLHAWTEETVETRFRYRRPGLWVLGVRAFRLARPIALEVTADQLGCKTWVPLDPPRSTAGVVPVLDAEEFARRMDRLRATLDAGA